MSVDSDHVIQEPVIEKPIIDESNIDGPVISEHEEGTVIEEHQERTIEERKRNGWEVIERPENTRGEEDEGDLVNDPGEEESVLLRTSTTVSGQEQGLLPIF